MSARCDVNHLCVDSLVMVREEIDNRKGLFAARAERERAREGNVNHHSSCLLRS